MRFIDEMEVLRRKVNLIDRPTHHGPWTPAEVDIIEAAFWARSVLEIIGDIGFHKYEHTLKLNIRTTRSVDDPEHPGSAKAIYEHNSHISLKNLLEFIIHFRYFSFNRHADGQHCLDVMSDRHERQQIYYTDFIAALRSLILSKKLLSLAMCDLVERDFTSNANHDWASPDRWTFASITLHTLLYEHLRSETVLKRIIMGEIFGISLVPDEVLPELYFFQSQLGPGQKVVIGFGPAWKSGQDVFSPPVDQRSLFDLIRSYYVST